MSIHSQVEQDLHQLKQRVAVFHSLVVGAPTIGT